MIDYFLWGGIITLWFMLGFFFVAFDGTKKSPLETIFLVTIGPIVLLCYAAIECWYWFVGRYK